MDNAYKGFSLSHDCHFDIDRNVSTAHCTSSSGDSVDLLSQTICITVVVSDLCITNVAHGWWVSIQSIQWPFSSSLNANKLLWIETHQP